MHCLRKLIGKRRLLGGLVMMPIFLWIALITVAPTDWARARLARRLSMEIGQPVHLGAVRIGPLGGVTLEGLRIGSDDAPEGPWLRADTTQIDLGLPQLLIGQCLPSNVRIDGLFVTYHRSPEGFCPIATALFDRSHDHSLGSKGKTTSPRGTVRLQIQAGTLRLIDDPTDTRVEVTTLDGLVVWEAERLVVEKVTGQLNGGTIDLVAQFDRTNRAPAVEGQFRAKGVRIDSHWQGLEMFVPFLASAGDALEGQMNLSIYVRGQGVSAEYLRAGLVGQGMIQLDPIRLDGSKLVSELIPSRGIDARVGAIRSEFKIASQKIATENLTIELGPVPIVLSGWTDFDGLVDYRVRTDGLSHQLRGNLGELLELVDEVSDLRITGNLEDLNLTVGGKPFTRQEGKDRLNQLGKSLRERMLR